MSQLIVPNYKATQVAGDNVHLGHLFSILVDPQ